MAEGLTIRWEAEQTMYFCLGTVVDTEDHSNVLKPWHPKIDMYQGSVIAIPRSLGCGPDAADVVGSYDIPVTA